MSDNDDLPCGHPIDDSLFDAKSGGRILIVHPAVGDHVPPIAWCVDGCGWVDLTPERYEELKAVRR